MKKVAVVGNGITGLVAALTLLEEGNTRVAFFGNGPIGGLGSGVLFPGKSDVWIERFYHHIFLNDVDVIALFKKVGLENRLRWQKSSVGVFADGKIWPFTSALDLLRFKPMGNLFQRLRFGMIAVDMRQRKEWRDLDSKTVEEFYRKRNNIRGFEAVWAPLLRAKFDAHSRDVSAAFLWGRIHARFGSRQKGSELLGYPEGGFQPLFDRMARLIQNHPHSDFRSPQKVVKVIPGRHPRVMTDRTQETFDHVFVATGLTSPETLIDSLPTSYPRITENDKVGVVCLMLVLKHRLSPVYWMNVCERGFPFGGIVEHTNLVSPSMYGNVHVVYVFSYLRPSHPFMRLTAEEYLKVSIPYLNRIFPSFSTEAILHRFIFKTLHASPVYRRGYQETVVDRMTPLPGVDFALMSQVYPFDRNLSHGAELGKEMVRLYLRNSV